MDRRLSWLGSFNLDPRSSRLNTEMAVLIDSPSAGADLAARMQRDRAPDRSWQVMIEPRSRRLTWQGERDGQAVSCVMEPDTLPGPG